ncbi:MAG: hypothetical protein ACK5JH_11180 [Anaerocolumna sp.]
MFLFWGNEIIVYSYFEILRRRSKLIRKRIRRKREREVKRQEEKKTRRKKTRRKEGESYGRVVYITKGEEGLISGR